MSKTIRPDLFAKVMALPKNLREDLLDLLGGSSIEDAHLSEIISNLSHPLSRPPLPAEQQNVTR
ncbi:hypothetical protein [Actibacterium pelagium]|uniref:Uncharacterized protein n=1 Tax=Actibacterium pelagium TaxID=2029103 RepID=A0A917A9A2_9RHOB|nr:hypothetical protein [Actibacterium pelagium]GGE36573.1 hypothetical protein GCM10011517_00390 [Actibacterium pelagium]